MNTQLMLTALKTDLGIQATAYDTRLEARLTDAQTALTALGIVLEDTQADRDLVVMYAAWLWNSRISGEPMPRMLITARNNRLFGQKARTA